MHVVITGASRGIGAALAREYLSHGEKVTLVARSKLQLEELAQTGGARAFPVEADLCEAEQATSWLPAAIERLGPIDVLVNNAGMQLLGRVAELDTEEVGKMVALNVMAPIRLTRAVLPDMIARRSGCIVDIASMAALTPAPYMSHYSATKAALATASECLRIELEGTGVHVLTVYPGPVTTEMSQGAFDVLHKTPAVANMPTGTPASLARVLFRAIAERQPRVIYPKIYAAATYMPTFARWITKKIAPRPLEVRKL